MNFRTFVRKHLGHVRACFTMHWFLKGRVHLTDLVAYTLLVHREEIATNVTRDNPLYEKLAKKKVA